MKRIQVDNEQTQQKLSGIEAMHRSSFTDPFLSESPYRNSPIQPTRLQKPTDSLR